MLTRGELDRNHLKHDGAFGMVEHGVKTEHTSELTAAVLLQFTYAVVNINSTRENSINKKRVVGILSSFASNSTLP
jgi:hypothetical protein